MFIIDILFQHVPVLCRLYTLIMLLIEYTYTCIINIEISVEYTCIYIFDQLQHILCYKRYADNLFR